MSTTLNGQLFLPSTEPALIGSFRYFNEHDTEFAEVGCYSMTMRVARTIPTVEVSLQILTPVDYHVMGDIVSLIPLGSPENFNSAIRALFTSATFQPTSIATMPLSRSTLNNISLRPGCRMRSRPGKGKAVSVTGFLTGLERNEDKTVKEFIVDVDTVTFLGQPAGSAAPKAEESPAKIGIDTKSDQPASKKRKMADDIAQEEADDKEEGSSNGRLRRR
ncbi:hypothetical protein B0H17DRAFT_1215002 [Mycena rosella]|uniref:Uncharacterized protein n=1 Tax=Mycena rosella TaxID=1033263 RepID=A0AAD7CLU7_MYCRO|nr:hypothetical protein B0H17DRAFT_1215002 [Mycena rosella]